MSRILFEPSQRLLWRIMLAFTLVLMIQAGASGYLIFNAMDKLLQANLNGKLFRVAALAADDPIISHTLDVSDEDRNAQQVLDQASGFFTELTSLVDVRRAYLFRLEENRFVYLAGTIDTERLKKVPTPLLNASELQTLREGHTITSRPFRLEPGGLMKAVYVPILRNGNMVGLLAIDDDAQDLESLTRLKQQLRAIAAGAFFIVVLVSFLLARTIVRSVRKLVDAAENMGLGDFSARFNVTGNDEINFLGQTFNDMAEDIQARDEQISRMNEAALADARQLYEHVLRAAYSAILTADKDDLLTSENPAAAELLGPAPDGPITMTRRLGPYPELLKLWRQRRLARDVEVTIVRAGDTRVVEATIAQLTDHRNQPIGHSLTLVDRTEITELQSELAMRDRLAALGELAAGIAHEIRNPLNGIQLMLGLVHEDLREKGVTDERFKNIYDEVSRLNTILNDFLLFARPKAIERTPSSLTDLAEDALMLIAPQIETKQIEIVRTYDEIIPAATVDQAAMRRVLVNLVKNACEAMDTSGKLFIEISGPATTGNGFRIRVRDTGPGIAEDVMNRLFNPFVTTKDEGTGLGLSIVHKTIINHHGSITCRNHPDGGACFTVILPAGEE
ncbi:MAG: ATP-binding protein [Candidatus Lernaella stagnicola]|nr:ATP-binding protein [Candidatus Lernaella stagnicola]